MANSFEELVTQIKDRLDILDVVSQQVILKKNGSHYWGLCPFHKEKTPSFSVNPALGIYKCFGCGAGGDAITFIMKTQNKEFIEVIREYAEKLGLELPKTFHKSESKELKDEMIRACAKAAEFYNLRLLMDKEPETLHVLDYLKNRGITKEIIEKYTLGIAPKAYAMFYKKFRHDFSEEVMEKAGLIIKTREGEYIDRFRNRAIIPIRNEFGEYVAFGARAVEKDQMPKYLNSSDSLIYNKSKILYGLYTAKDAIKNEDSVVLMEGYFDVISAQAHGIENAVASCGTALTPDHIKLLSRYTPSRKIYLSFDTDSAGQKATNRNAALIKEAFSGLGNIKQFDESYISTSNDKYSCEIRVIAPPEGKDPDEFIRSVGAESYKEYMQHAPLLIDFQLNNILKEKPKTPIEKTKVVKEIIPLLMEIQNKIIQAEYVKMVSDALSVDEKALLSELKTASRTEIIKNSDVSKIVKKNIPISQKAQKNLLSVFLVTDNHFTLDEISRIIGDTPFTDETLINVKSTIDKLTCTVNNVKELIDKLYTTYVNEPEVQKLITDLISISESFQNLDETDFLTAIRENINKINDCQNEKEKEKIRNLYKSANDNETEALKIQMQLRDKINNRLKLEKMNE
ncbi:dNA primase [Clostridium sp. CAG:715]|jgi:DNA primase|nr:dNA primase [Clostridium sp. CAG:715]DAA86904.1 MAG TPA: DNA primase [Candidatus Gastranaerophilales bacterium HUM_2]